MRNIIRVELFERYMKENKLTKNKFCKLCKISPSTLNKIMTNNENFGIIALFKIAKVIHILVFEMFQ